MKLVLYSGGQKTSNRLIHHALFQLVNPNKNKSMTYIPFCQDRSDLFFKKAIKRYQGVGFKRFHCLPVDVPFTRTDLSKALGSDVIYLAGGNTPITIKSVCYLVYRSVYNFNHSHVE